MIKVGFEIAINKRFYIDKPSLPLDEIKADIAQLEREIARQLEGLLA